MSDRLPRVTADDVLRVLRQAGWMVVRQTGSHMVLHHVTRLGRVVIPYHRRKTLKLATLESILEDAGLSQEAFRRLL